MTETTKPKDTRYKRYTKYCTYENKWLSELRTFILAVDAALVIVLISIILSCFYVNKEYQRSLITLLGEVQEVTGPGLNFRLPILTSRYIADTRMEEMEVSTWIATKGGANRVGIVMVINHKIKPDAETIINLYKLYGGRFDYEGRLLAKAAKDRLKSAVSQHEIASVTDNRGEIKGEVFIEIEKVAEKYGILIKDIQLVDISFEPTYMAKLVGVQEARAKAAAAKEKEIEAKFIANKAVEAARGEADSKKLRAEAEAYKLRVESVEKAAAIERVGKANAAAIKAQNAAARNASGLAELRKAEAMKNWNGSVPQFMSGGGAGGSIFPFMNVKDMVK